VAIPPCTTLAPGRVRRHPGARARYRLPIVSKRKIRTPRQLSRTRPGRGKRSAGESAKTPNCTRI
ncbi:MAG: hypothetical protein, partial [Olavius algarvensis spirochete endosymbiont]